MELEGRAALVTGGARRVGRAIVAELAGAGCDLAIHYRRSGEEAAELAGLVAEAGRRAVLVRGDLNDPACWPEIIRAAVDGLGRLDILVNNAAVFTPPEADTIERFDGELWESTIRTNLVAPVALCHHARPHLEASGTGKIVNLCDISAERPWPDHLAYCTSKAGLVAVTRGLARALAPRIAVNAVAPGIAAFPEDYSTEHRRELTSRVPLRRQGTPEEVARLVRFLVESGDYITGQVIAIDGGRSIV